MRVPKISLLPFMAALATLSQVSYAQNSPQDYIKAHNAARSQVGVGPMRWDTSVASYAQKYVNTLKGSCNMVHSGGPYGENFAWSSADLKGTDAVSMWVGEKQYYNYNSNTCAAGQECGHYTQVVWQNSVRLGCAKVTCDNGGTIISCNYDPPGNYVGERPYSNGHVAYPQDPPQDYLNAHNAARSQVRVPNLVWDDTVAAFAQNYANQRKGDCQLIHSGGSGRYGENLALSSGNLTGTDAVNMWVDEKQYYDYNSNTCVVGKLCGHYTQVVWRNSLRLGCAKVTCDNGGTFIGCNYDPPGNVVGQKSY